MREMVMSFDIQALKEAAEHSGERETYKVVDKRRHYDIAVGTRISDFGQPSFFIEVVFRLCLGGQQVDIRRMLKCLSLLEKLETMGYQLSCQDDGILSWEFIVAP